MILFFLLSAILPCLLIGKFSSFTFKVIIDRYVLNAALLGFCGFYTSLALLLCSLMTFILGLPW